MLNRITVKTYKHVVLYSILTTVFSIVLSLIIMIVSLSYTYPEALEAPVTYFITVLVPLFVAPIVGFVAFSLVLKLEQAHENLEKISQTDALTLVYNRGFFLQHVEKELKLRQADTPFALILFDVDNFKAFNDTYGHLLGDQILKVCAAEAASCIRKDDCIARYGGEEFAVFLNGCSVEKAEEVGERIRQRIADVRLPYKDLSLSITVSMGLVATKKGLALETLASTADQAMYQAKHSGKNRLHCLSI